MFFPFLFSLYVFTRLLLLCAFTISFWIRELRKGNDGNDDHDGESVVELNDRKEEFSLSPTS